MDIYASIMYACKHVSTHDKWCTSIAIIHSGQLDPYIPQRSPYICKTHKYLIKILDFRVNYIKRKEKKKCVANRIDTKASHG